MPVAVGTTDHESGAVVTMTLGGGPAMTGEGEPESTGLGSPGTFTGLGWPPRWQEGLHATASVWGFYSPGAKKLIIGSVDKGLVPNLLMAGDYA